jgi:hypothetical protein
MSQIVLIAIASEGVAGGWTLSGEDEWVSDSGHMSVTSLATSPDYTLQKLIKGKLWNSVHELDGMDFRDSRLASLEFHTTCPQRTSIPRIRPPSSSQYYRWTLLPHLKISANTDNSYRPVWIVKGHANWKWGALSPSLRKWTTQINHRFSSTIKISSAFLVFLGLRLMWISDPSYTSNRTAWSLKSIPATSNDTWLIRCKSSFPLVISLALSYPLR